MTIQITNETQLLMSSLLSRLKFEVADYRILPFLSADGSNLFIRFLAEKNGNKKILDASISEQLFNDMSSICGLDPNEELKNILVVEITKELNERD